MDYKLLFKIISEVIGGLGIFLLGMKYMSEGLQSISGERLRKMIGLVTNNRVMGCWLDWRLPVLCSPAP